MGGGSPATSSSNPNGRERAIETLIDLEKPHGDFYRAARVVDEAVPIAQNSRPNLITKTALVEQALSLGVYEIDSIQKYDEAFLTTHDENITTNASTDAATVEGGQNSGSSNNTETIKKVDSLTRERIFHYQNKIINRNKYGSSAITETVEPAKTTPPPGLIAALRKLYEESNRTINNTNSDEDNNTESSSKQLKIDTSAKASEDLFELRKLLEAVSSHAVFQNSNAASQTESKEASPNAMNSISLEALMLNVVKHVASNEEPSAYVHTLILAILSVLTGQMIPKDDTVKTDPKTAQGKPRLAKNNEMDEHQNDYYPSHASVQVGALLSLFPVSTENDNVYATLLNYFTDAAAVYEERLEIQKARMLAKIETPPPSTSDSVVVVVTDDTAGTDPAPETNLSPTPTTPATPEPNEEQQEDAVVSEQEDDTGREEPYESNNDEEEEDEEESSSSSSSSSSSEEDSSSDEEEEEEDTGAMMSDAVVDTDEEEVIALAMSMAEHEETDRLGETTEATDRQEAAPEDESHRPEDSAENSVAPPPPSETPVSHSTTDDIQSFKDNDDDANLPPFPKAPRVASRLLLSGDGNEETVGLDGDGSSHTSDTLPVLNPSELSEFSSISSSYVVCHLLRYTDHLVHQQMFPLKEKISCEPPITPGGMGSTLLGSGDVNMSTSASSVKNPYKSELRQETTLHLLTALLLLLLDQRNDLIESFRKAVDREQRFARDGNLDSDDGDEDNSSRVPLSSSGEEDDPAMALAMNYVEDDVPLSSESLENKGMRRKAAAAAHDAAAMLKSLRKQTNAWKKELSLYSESLLRAMKLLRKFLQSLTRDALLDGGASKNYCNLLELHSYLPGFVTKKLVTALETLSSGSHNDSFFEDRDESERVLRSVNLYQESLLLWGECVPLMYPTESSRSTLLKDSIESCLVDASIECPSLEKITSLPSVVATVKMHRLTVLCRQLRVRDFLDGFLSKPIPYIADEEVTENPEIEGIKKSGFRMADGPTVSSSLVSYLLDSTRKLNGICEEAEKLCLAICHRYHVRSLLLDGFFALTETQIEDKMNASTNKALSTGDSLRVSACASNSFQFDGTKCSDSIALISGASDSGNTAGVNGSAHQRASKVWGTVLSTHQYSPKTGIHRWAVRLDKCERGHVFIGVATSQASTRTYVGGDKFGWGMIGTQALWHDRRKIRGDYGATFRTGSTIIVTLDTDVGTLSFSSWKDTSSSSFSVDPLVQNVVSPRRAGQIGGIVEDWGVAFEGLPLDSKMYPAVGLYQRDDRVTLLPVENHVGLKSLNGLSEVSGGECFYPRSYDGDGGVSSVIRKYNDELTWDGLVYAAQTLAFNGLPSTESSLMAQLRPSLLSALCLIPTSVPTLSSRSALVLMPHISRFITTFADGDNFGQNTDNVDSFVQGKWLIKTTADLGSNSKMDEYVVDLVPSVEGPSNGFIGKGKRIGGKSKCNEVEMYGIIQGSSIIFVEDWSDRKDAQHPKNDIDASSSCIAVARLSLDRHKFEGSYRNIKHGSTGQIYGVFNDFQPYKLNNSTEALLGLAQSHFSSMLNDDTADDLEHADRFRVESNEPLETILARRQSLKEVWSRKVFCNTSCVKNDSSESDIQFLKRLYSLPLSVEEVSGIRTDLMLSKLSAVSFASKSTDSESQDNLLDHIKILDEGMSKECGLGSLRTLHPVLYDKAKQDIIGTILHFSDVGTDELRDTSGASLDINNVLQVSWRAALAIMERGIRRALSSSPPGSRRDACHDICCLYSDLSRFLLSLDVGLKIQPRMSVDIVASDVSLLFSLILDKSDLDFLCIEMEKSSIRGILRLLSLSEISKVLAVVGLKNDVISESLLHGLPSLLGRGKLNHVTNSFPTSERIDPLESLPELDGHYMFHLSGCRISVKESLRNEVLAIYSSIGKIIDSIVTCSSEDKCSDTQKNSLLLTALTTFVGNLMCGDIDDIMSQSSILSSLPRILSIYRPSLLQQSLNQEEKQEEKFLQFLQNMCFRDISRTILRCSVAASHTIIYQATRALSDTSKLSIERRHCLDFLLSEIVKTVKLIEGENQRYISSKIERQCDTEWVNWASTQEEIGPEKEKEGFDDEAQNGTSSLVEFLCSTGSLLTNFVHGGSKKQPLSKALPATTGKHSESPPAVILFTQQFLSHWLHILCAVFHSRTCLDFVVKDKKWFYCLFEAIGLIPSDRDSGKSNRMQLRAHDEGILPARFRARLLRLFSCYIEAFEPDSGIIEGLFHLAGVTTDMVTQSLDDEECFVSRECISLLRQLHFPTNKQWRYLVNECVSSIVSDSCGDSGSFCKRIGVLAFISGSIDKISRGSFVLLKPSASQAVSPDHQISSSSKSHPSGIGGNSVPAPSVGATPHHVVGNGTEGVIAGLCKDDASAGIVSNIDIKNGICEVILVARRKESNILQNSSENRHGRFVGSARHILTVRALRTPLSDVVTALEKPLCLGDDFPIDQFCGKLLRTSLNSLSCAISLTPSDDSDSLTTTEQTKDRSQQKESDGHGREKTEEGDESKSLRAGTVGLASDLMVIRSCIVLLSERSALSSALQNDENRRSLAKILDLAWPGVPDSGANDEIVRTLTKKSLSSLPQHEARFAHLISLSREITFRMIVMKKTPVDKHKERLESFRERVSLKEETTTFPSNTAYEEKVIESNSNDRVDNAEATRESEINSGRSISQSTGGSISEDDDENESGTAAAHLREAAIAQMAELGLPRSWSEFALRRTGGINIEAAVTYCLERGPEIERLLAEEQERDQLNQPEAAGGPRRRGARDSSSNRLLRQLLEMGFPRRWCTEALAVTGNNVDEALTWILNNGERLSEEDEAMGNDEADVNDGEEDDSIEDDEDETEAAGSEGGTGEQSRITSNQEDNPETPGMIGWSGSVIPLRFISGRAIVNPEKMEISGLPSGGFSSVGTKGVMLTSGRWYYEAVLETAGCLQIGWADGSFAGHCHADRGDGCGDGPSSWAFDGWRRYRWSATATEWGCRWKEGDVVGCLVDMDNRVVSFTLNGEGESIGMGVAFSGEGFRPCGGVYACVSFNRREKLRLVLGGKGSESFRYEPPEGYKGVGEAVLAAVVERDDLVKKEAILDSMSVVSEEKPKRFLCDFSDGEHGHELMAWAHRYYGSDASVHLGSSRSKSSGQKSSITTVEAKSASFLVNRLSSAWKDESSREQNDSFDFNEIFHSLWEGYEVTQKQIIFEIFQECIALAVLLSRKFILHLMLTQGIDFDIHLLMSDKDKVEGAIKFWKMFEACTSLRNAGWVGEAGAMAIAAEALGLGISSNDQISARAGAERPGITAASDLDEGLLLPSVGSTQVLTSILLPSGEDQYTGLSLAAIAEPSMGSDGGGGLLSFLQEGLQSAVIRSSSLRDVVIAVIRRSVRCLAVVEYENDDFDINEENDNDNDGSEEKLKGSGKKADDSDIDTAMALPDARLISYLSGLLLSRPVQNAVESHLAIEEELFQAWAVGLLSASIPWRMLCAFSTAGVLNMNPRALLNCLKSSKILARYFGRLKSTVSRRIWVERAATPVSSRYSQAMVELLTSVRRSVAILTTKCLPFDFLKFWSQLNVDAATPLSLFDSLDNRSDEESWESSEGWISSDAGWQVWSGTVEFMAVDWKTPTLSPTRRFMDGGDGPPMLRPGCLVMRGIDWSQRSDKSNGDDDGKSLYDNEKARRDEEKQASKSETTNSESNVPSGSEIVSTNETAASSDPAEDDGNADENEKGSKGPPQVVPGTDITENSENKAEKKKKKKAGPKLPVGTVLAIEPWNGVDGLARRVRWKLTGKEGTYRFGGEGGRFDLCHVETNSKETRVKKRHPLPETYEQCASRHGFGLKKKYNVLLRLKRSGTKVLIDGESSYLHEGVLEWPDFCAGVKVRCTRSGNGTFVVEEKQLLFGSKDSGWEARFGQPSYVPGTTYVLSTAGGDCSDNIDCLSANSCCYEELAGDTTFDVSVLKNPADGSDVKVKSKMRLLGNKLKVAEFDRNLPVPQAPLPGPITFDRDFHASSLSLSRDGRTVSCVSSDGRGTAFASIGFTKGVHYWEVKLEQADIGSVFIGVAEKPLGNGSGSSYSHESSPRLNRWHGWGFVNFRATYSSGAERVYGSHCHAGDTVGILLDCDAGRVSFFFDGLKYGEHILNDLGCAFENISPFGFNVDGCGSGGAGQGAPSGFENGPSSRFPAQGTVRPRTLWPVIGLRNQGDRATLSSKWCTSFGIDGTVALRNITAFQDLLDAYDEENFSSERKQQSTFPDWFCKEAFNEFLRWKKGSWNRSPTRGSGPQRFASFGLDMDFDTSPIACAAASASLGLDTVLLTGDRVKLTRSAGRRLELAEEAVVLGTYQGRLFYKLVSQKSEGGSLSEGGGRAWCWDESEVVDGLPFILPPKGLGVPLPKLSRFECPAPGGLRIVYENGAVLRSDLEIFDGSINLGTIPVHSIIGKTDVLDRRVNSCGVVRFRVRWEEIGEGWISARIRGGTEEAIVEYIHESDESVDDEAKAVYAEPSQCAKAWYDAWMNKKHELHPDSALDISDIKTYQEFLDLSTSAIIPGLSASESDAVLVSAMNAISNYSDVGDAVECSFSPIASALSYALCTAGKLDATVVGASMPAKQAAVEIFADFKDIPTLKSILARLALLRAFNRRVRLALPWCSIRPCQEGSAMFGGLVGHGASPDRAGRARDKKSQKNWVQVPSIASKIRSFRKLFFTSVKRDFLQSVVEATTTPTPLSHDEYELPREIRTVRINRLKAGRAMLGDDRASKKKYSVFAQLQGETKNWGGAALRRGYVAKGHGGQKRAFKVKLVGEGVNDYSGPYREAFTDAVGEVLKTDDDGIGVLGVLDKSPNNSSNVGDERDLYMFSLNGKKQTTLTLKPLDTPMSPTEMRIRSTFATLTGTRDEASREVEEALVFLGRVAGTAYRHGISLDLPLPMGVVWKSLTEENVSALEKLRELDYLASKLADEETAEQSPLLWWQQRMVNAFAEGLGNVLPVEILPLLTGEELRDTFCGNPEVDVDLLKQVVEYEGYEETDQVIEYFWQTLQGMTNEERKKFLQFVWARNRLPMRESDFEAPFKIQRDSLNVEERADQALPSASTCFFSLTLPNYTSQEILREKLLFAINNVTTMETDFQTNSAEIAEGYRAF